MKQIKIIEHRPTKKNQKAVEKVVYKFHGKFDFTVSNEDSNHSYWTFLSSINAQTAIDLINEKVNHCSASFSDL